MIVETQNVNVDLDALLFNQSDEFNLGYLTI
jgi:hypothetical protein